MIKRTKFNVILLGGTSGKTSLIDRNKGYDFEYIPLVTIGIDTSIETKIIDNTTYKFKIFDTAGGERYRSTFSSTIKISDGILIVFDVTNKVTFKEVNVFLQNIEENRNREKIYLYF